MNKELLKTLCNAACIGHISDASAIAANELKKYAEVRTFGTTGIIAEINKDKKRTIMLEAHIDEVGFIVTNIFDDGFVKVANIGGNDARILPATPVIIHGKADIQAVFASVPPHLADNSANVENIDEILLDTGLNGTVHDFVSVGDYVTYSSQCEDLADGKICGKSLDDRCAVAALIEVASRIYNKDLPVNVVICLSEQEELGTRGARPAAFSLNIDEAVAVDVSFGNAPDVPPSKCGALGDGPMIGISPILDRKITTMLTVLAVSHKIHYQLEVMGGTTGTDADVISITKDGIPCGLVSIPLRNMHTPCEIIDIFDIECICDLLENYILFGGAFDDGIV